MSESETGSKNTRTHEPGGVYGDEASSKYEMKWSEVGAGSGQGQGNAGQRSGQRWPEVRAMLARGRREASVNGDRCGQTHDFVVRALRTVGGDWSGRKKRQCVR